MPTFYFNHRTAEGLAKSREGDTFADAEAARRDAVMAARQMVANALIAGTPLSVATEGSYEVADESGTVVAVVSFTDAIHEDMRT